MLSVASLKEQRDDARDAKQTSAGTAGSEPVNGSLCGECSIEPSRGARGRQSSLVPW